MPRSTDKERFLIKAKFKWNKVVHLTRLTRVKNTPNLKSNEVSKIQLVYQ